MKAAFDEVATGYAAHRQGYSPATVDFLAREFGSGASVLDVATGTGVLAEQIRPRVGRVVGADIARLMLASARPPVVVAPAERLPFRAGSFDGLTCAEAFHWMDAPRALASFGRVVRPGGAMAILGKTEDEGEPYKRLVKSLYKELTRREYKSASDPDAQRRMLIGAGWRVERFAWDIEWTAERYIGQVRSWVALRRQVADLGERYYGEFERRLRALAGPGRFLERNYDDVYFRRA